MKLYTEEQVILLLDLSKLRLMHSKDILLAQVTPIELPSDEEIKKLTQYLTDNYYEGAKWMKEQIINNKPLENK